MHATDGFKVSNGSADTTAVPLMGGEYGIIAVATWGGGNVVVEGLSNDGSTYIPVHTAITANGYATFKIPPGMYRLNITTATGVYVTVYRIPGA